jgi:hypothetical protein
MRFHELQNIRLLPVRLLQPPEGLFVIAQPEVGVHKRAGRNIPRLFAGLQFLQQPQASARRPACASARISVPAVGALAQRPLAVHFGGVLNDYSPSTVKGGPWEMHGTWSLDLRGESSTADFSAVMTMSGYGKTAAGDVDPTQAGAGAHTHNIKLTNATITWDMTGCPTYSPAAVQGFQINGVVSLMTGNGSNAPFETSPPSSTLQVCVTGGDLVAYSVPYSNLSLVFGAPANTHFGMQPIHGVVRSVEFSTERRVPRYTPRR